MGSGLGLYAVLGRPLACANILIDRLRRISGQWAVVHMRMRYFLSLFLKVPYAM